MAPIFKTRARIDHDEVPGFTNETIQPHIYDEVEEICEELPDDAAKNDVRDFDGLEWLGCGCYRNVFGFTEQTHVPFDDPENYVLKIDYGGTPKGNKAELKALRTLPKEIVDRFLVPAVMAAESFRWIIMERAETDDVSYREARLVREELNNLGYYYADTKASNLGIHDDEVKLVDYGYRWNRDGSRIIDV